MRTLIIAVFLAMFFLACAGPPSQKDATATAGMGGLCEVRSELLPVVYFDVVIQSGSADDPVGYEGLAYFAANYLRCGTASFNRREIDSILRHIGAVLEIRVERELIEISGKTLRENLEIFYDLFSEIILTPGFPGQEAPRLRLDQEHALHNMVRDDVSLSRAVLLAELYRGHPYAHPIQGYFSTIAKLDSGRAYDFYQKHFLRGNILAGLGGDYPREFAARFLADLNRLKEGRVVRTDTVIENQKGCRLVLVEKEGRDQAQIRIGRLVDYGRGDEAWFPLLLANSHLGQHRESFGRLYTTIRSERGLSYGAYSYHEHFEQQGWSKNQRPLLMMNPQYASIWTYPQRVNAEFACKLAIFELQELLAKGISSDRLEMMKNYQINSFPFLVETVEQHLRQALDARLYDQPNFLENYDSLIKAVDIKTVPAAMAQHWSAEDMVIVIVTDSAEAMKSEFLSPETALVLPAGATSAGLEETNSMVMNLNLGLRPERITIIGAEELFH